MAKQKATLKDSRIHPDHTSQKSRVNRIRGQVDGIERMIDERRYCVDIVQQIKAVRSALTGLENSIIETHLRGCVQSAMTSKDAHDAEQKIQEIMKIMAK
ncbi:MAG: metal-sensitive transcriptional regulator [Bdellovibrionales bacterium]|nr:metal-sensitive transcriptional regulator [Bdellovibrionales bacterium]